MIPVILGASLSTSCYTQHRLQHACIAMIGAYQLAYPHNHKPHCRGVAIVQQLSWRRQSREAHQRRTFLLVYIYTPHQYTHTCGTNAYTSTNEHTHKYKHTITPSHTQASMQAFLLFLQLKWTPLYAAADSGHTKIVQYLIEERGCDSSVVTVVS